MEMILFAVIALGPFLFMTYLIFLGAYQDLKSDIAERLARRRQRLRKPGHQQEFWGGLPVSFPLPI